jgi:hypothetical protein
LKESGFATESGPSGAWRMDPFSMVLSERTLRSAAFAEAYSLSTGLIVPAMN